MAIEKKRMQQLHGAYEQLNTDNLLIGEMAIPSNHRPIIKTDTDTITELLTLDEFQEVSDLRDDMMEALRDVRQLAIDKVGINDSITSSLQTWSSNKISEMLENAKNGFKNATGTSFDLNTAEGGIRVNKIEGATHKSANIAYADDGKNTVAFENYKRIECSGKAGTYTFSANITGGSSDETFRVLLWTADGNEAGGCWIRANAGRTSEIINAVSDFAYAWLYSANGYGGTESCTYTDFMLNEGATALPYEPYGMHSAGEYGLVDLGTLSWVYQDVNKRFYTENMRDFMVFPTSNSNVFKGICERYRVVAFADVMDKRIYADSYGYLFVDDSGYTNVDAFKQSLKGVMLAYEVKEGVTPSEYVLVIEETGKNLLDKGVNSAIVNGIQIVNNGDGTYTLNGTATDYVGFRSEAHNVKVGKTYRFIGCPAGGNNATYSIWTNDGISGGLDVGYGATYTAQSNIFYMDIQIRQGVTCDNLVFKPMITDDLNATYDNSFLPYKHNTVFVPLTAPLCSIGDIKDEIIRNADGSGVLVRRYGYVDLGSLNWDFYTDGVKHQFFVNVPTIAIPTIGKTADAICGKYPTVTGDEAWANDYGMSVDDNRNLKIHDSAYSSASEFKSAMVGHILVYKLDTPTTTPLTAEQIEAIHSLASFKDKTIITTAEGLANLDISYSDNEVASTSLNAENISIIVSKSEEGSDIPTEVLDITNEIEVMKNGKVVSIYLRSAYKSFTLPEDFRPSRAIYFNVLAGGNERQSALCVVGTDGVVKVYSSSVSISYWYGSVTYILN